MADEQDDVQAVKVDIPAITDWVVAIAFITQGLKYLHKNEWKKMLAFYFILSFVIFIVFSNLDQIGLLLEKIKGLWAGKP